LSEGSICELDQTFELAPDNRANSGSGGRMLNNRTNAREDARACGSMLAAQVGPEPYPTRPVRLIVGFPPGRPTDIVARIVASWLFEQVIVDSQY
jgi:hypothetical protein